MAQALALLITAVVKDIAILWVQVWDVAKVSHLALKSEPSQPLGDFKNRKETINLQQCETEMFVTEMEEAQPTTPATAAASAGVALAIVARRNSNEKSNWRTANKEYSVMHCSTKSYPTKICEVSFHINKNIYICFYVLKNLFYNSPSFLFLIFKYFTFFVYDTQTTNALGCMKEQKKYC